MDSPINSSSMLNQIAGRKADFAAKRVGEELVLVPVTKEVAELDSMFTLNEVGSFIWEHISDDTTEEGLCTAIVQEFEISSEVAKRDLTDFLGQISLLING